MPTPNEMGAPPSSERTRWEHKTISVYLNLSTRDFLDHQGLVRRFERIVKDRLDREAQEGWEADGPTGWSALQAAGRIRRRQTFVLTSGIYQAGYVYEDVTVPLKRPARSE